MRPASIVAFERCYILAWVIGLINVIITWSARPAVASLPGVPVPQDMTQFLILVTIGGTILTWVLWYLVSRKASVFAKWVVSVFFVVGLIGLVWGAYYSPFPTGMGAVLIIICWIFQVVALAALYTPASNRWLGVGGRA